MKSVWDLKSYLKSTLLFYQEQPYQDNTQHRLCHLDPLAPCNLQIPRRVHSPGTSSRTTRLAVFTHWWTSLPGIPWRVVVILFRRVIKQQAPRQVRWPVQRNHGKLLSIYRLVKLHTGYLLFMLRKRLGRRLSKWDFQSEMPIPLEIVDIPFSGI